MKRTELAAPVGAGLIVVSSLFYASYGIWTTLMGDFFGGFTASALRSLLVLLMLTPIALLTRQLTKDGWREDRSTFVGLVLTAALIWGPLYYAILQVGIGVALTVNYASIVIGMLLFGRILLGEHMTVAKGMAMALGLTGIGLIFAPGGTQLPVPALLAALVSGLSIAAHTVIAKKLPRNATQTTIYMWVASLLANTMLALVLEDAPTPQWRNEWLYLLCFAAASVAASWTFIRGVKLIESGTAGLLGLSEIVFAVAFGVVFFSESPTPTVLLGVGLIIVATGIPYLHAARSPALGGTAQQAFTGEADGHRERNTVRGGEAER